MNTSNSRIAVPALLLALLAPAGAQDKSAAERKAEARIRSLERTIAAQKLEIQRLKLQLAAGRKPAVAANPILVRQQAFAWQTVTAPAAHTETFEPLRKALVELRGKTDVAAARAATVEVQKAIAAARTVLARRLEARRAGGDPTGEPGGVPTVTSPVFPNFGVVPSATFPKPNPLLTGLYGHALDGLDRARNLLLLTADHAEGMRILDEMSRHLSVAERELWLRAKAKEKDGKRGR